MNAGSPPRISRRSFIRTLGAGALVVGFNTTTGSWVTAAQAQAGTGFDWLPPLDGTLHLDEATRAEYAQDFGDIVREQPLAVLKPGSVRDIKRLINFARHRDIRIVGRGRGHSAFGQAQSQGGVVIDISTLQTLHAIEGDRADVEAGIRWNTLLEATLARGLMPPALTDYIGQTVGGTLSVGGVGGMMHRYGAQVDNVLELEVVTGKGQIVTCSEKKRRDLFEAALAGQGQVAVIVRATIKLVPAPERIRVFNLIYPDLTTMTSETVRLMDDGRFDYLEGFSIPQPGGAWIHLLQAGSYYTSPANPDDTALLRGLSDIRAAMQVEDLRLWEFASRVPLSYPKQPHPWIDLILPYPDVDAFVASVEQTLKPLVAGDSFTILLYPVKPGRITRPLFRAPASEHAFGFGILRFTPNDEQAVAQALAYNRVLFEQCRELGGTHYPISAVHLEREDWERHYGEAFSTLAAAKRRYDPYAIIASGPDIFAAR